MLYSFYKLGGRTVECLRTHLSCLSSTVPYSQHGTAPHFLSI